MSGFVFSAVALLAVLTPGLVAQYRYYQAASKWDYSGNIELGSPRALLVAIPLSLLFHAIWIPGAQFLHYVSNTGAVDFRLAVALVTGHADVNLSSLQDQLANNRLFSIFAYFGTQALSAYFVGSTLAKRLSASKHQENVALSSAGALWHRRLGYVEEKPDFITVAVTLKLARKTYLFFGILESYELTQAGDLRYITLIGARRREMGGHPRDRAIYDLPGEYFIVCCDKVETVDIDYFWEIPTESEQSEVIRRSIKET